MSTLAVKAPAIASRAYRPIIGAMRIVRAPVAFSKNGARPRQAINGNHVWRDCETSVTAMKINKKNREAIFFVSSAFGLSCAFEKNRKTAARMPNAATKEVC